MNIGEGRTGSDINLRQMLPSRQKLNLAFLSFLAFAVIGVGWYINFPAMWLSFYAANPFTAIFGTGLFFVWFFGSMIVVMYNRKLWKLRRQRIRLTQKVKED